MATKIRLKRMGTKKRPFYRIVVIDSRLAVGGPYVESLGHYNPIEKPGKITTDVEKTFKWLDSGAEPSDTVASLFRQIGLTQKYLAQKAGQDTSSMEVKTVVTEHPKKRKKSKAKAEAPK